MKSWKTTLGGSLTTAGAALMGVNLVPTLNTVIPERWRAATMLAGFFLTVVGPVLHGLCARDNSVSSEAAGVKGSGGESEKGSRGDPSLSPFPPFPPSAPPSGKV